MKRCSIGGYRIPAERGSDLRRRRSPDAPARRITIPPIASVASARGEFFKAKPEFPLELERVYNITDGILRDIVIKKEDKKKRS